MTETYLDALEDLYIGLLAALWSPVHIERACCGGIWAIAHRVCKGLKSAANLSEDPVQKNVQPPLVRCGD